MLSLFDARELLNIRFFNANPEMTLKAKKEESFFYDITIRHTEEEDANVLFTEAIKILSKTN